MVRFLKNKAHLVLALISNVVYGFPSKSLTVIGVTGTDGKTTTATLIAEILKAAGYKVAVLTTVAAEINGKSYDTGFHVTTPSPFALQKYLSLAKKNEVKYFVLETTSHGLDQNRVFGISYHVSVITNISHEHLDYHKTYARYVAAKAKIIAASLKVLINKDDQSYELLKKYDPQKQVTYGRSNTADINPEKYPLNPSMPGEFNLYNALAALGVCLELGVLYETAAQVIEDYKTPLGRQDIVYSSDFSVMIDFAHTPNSFQQVLKTLRQTVSGRIIHVFGSAGMRDRGKRAEMGKVSSEYADVMVLTAEDPRNESVEQICRDIQNGINKSFVHISKDKDVPKGEFFVTIADRMQAIKYAVSIAKKGDIVLITGKGHEQSMNFGDGDRPWSDYTAVEKVLKNNHESDN